MGQDKVVPHIHPGIRVPTTMHQLNELGGGGSGVTVVSSLDALFGNIVFKHGGANDTAEFFALATIQEQLRVRSVRSTPAAEAARDMQARIPELKVLYISQLHLRNKGARMWGEVQHRLRGMNILKKKIRRKTEGIPKDSNKPKLREIKSEPIEMPTPASHSDGGKDIRICNLDHREEGKDESSRKPIDFTHDRLEIGLTMNAELDWRSEFECSVSGEGYSYMKSLIDGLLPLQKAKAWKFTLAQKAIGGPSAMNGATLLARGMLHGRCLQSLLDQYTQVICNLQRLTDVQEVERSDDVQNELEEIQRSADFNPAHVSDAADQYVGRAIRKNFDPKSGRLKKLIDMGDSFRSGALMLTDAEMVPGSWLGVLLKSGIRMEDVFLQGVTGPTAVDSCSNTWRDLLKHALSLQGSAARASVWTCGLTDSGLHNLFLDEDSRMWLFDMGEPALMPLPAFLTKFLMSFFHTLGMEEADGCGDWVNRFNPVSDGLLLTERTSRLLADAEDAFKKSLHHLMVEVFKGEEVVCTLLMKYAVLQLVSDAAFCLDKWEIKGGGVERQGGRAQALEKWLWRTLWDLYVAGYVVSKDWYAEVFKE